MSRESPEKTALRRQSRRAQRFQAVFGTDDGKWVLKDLMRKYHFFGTITKENDKITTEFLDGQRTVVLDILRTTATDLEKLIKLYESLPEDHNYE